MPRQARSCRHRRHALGWHMLPLTYRRVTNAQMTSQRDRAASSFDDFSDVHGRSVGYADDARNKKCASQN